MAPVDHPTFLTLIAQAQVVVSDSGGVQEAVAILKKPSVVVRNRTERPEALAAARMADRRSRPARMGRGVPVGPDR